MAKLFTKLKGFLKKNLVSWYGGFLVGYFKLTSWAKKDNIWNKTFVDNKNAKVHLKRKTTCQKVISFTLSLILELFM